MAAPLSHSERLMAEKTVCILLVRGENPSGERIYAYVAVRADKLEEFMEAQKSDTFYPEEHGVIVESGMGEPNEEVREKMERDYGFNHNAMTDIPDAEQAKDVTLSVTRAMQEKRND